MYKREVSMVRKTPDWAPITNNVRKYLLLFFQLIVITTGCLGKTVAHGTW